jgi:hypothetical protein
MNIGRTEMKISNDADERIYIAVSMSRFFLYSAVPNHYMTGIFSKTGIVTGKA